MRILGAKESLVEVWKRCYMRANPAKTFPKVLNTFKIRLNELETWDNCGGNELERQNKIMALKESIEITKKFIK